MLPFGQRSAEHCDKLQALRAAGDCQLHRFVLRTAAACCIRWKTGAAVLGRILLSRFYAAREAGAAVAFRTLAPRPQNADVELLRRVQERFMPLPPAAGLDAATTARLSAVAAATRKRPSRPSPGSFRRRRLRPRGGSTAMTVPVPRRRDVQEVRRTLR